MLSTWLVLHAKEIGDYTSNVVSQLLHLWICSSPFPWLGPSFGSPAPSSVRRGLGDFFFLFFAQRLLKQPILVPLTLAKEILYELESVRKDLMRLS